MDFTSNLIILTAENEHFSFSLETNKQTIFVISQNSNEFHPISHSLGDMEVPLSSGNDSHANETTAKQEPSLSLFGPIFLPFSAKLNLLAEVFRPINS